MVAANGGGSSLSSGADRMALLTHGWQKCLFPAVNSSLPAGSAVTAVGWGAQDVQQQYVTNELAYLDKTLADCAKLDVQASAQSSGIPDWLCYQTSADQNSVNDGGAFHGDSGGKLASKLQNRLLEALSWSRTEQDAGD